MHFEAIRNELGQVDAIQRFPDGATVPWTRIDEFYDLSDEVYLDFVDWQNEKGKLDLSDRPVDPLTLEQLKAQKKQELIAIASSKQEELVAGFAPPEQASWSRKVAEAKTFLASGVIEDAPMLKAEAIAISGATNNTVILRYTQGLATKILQKSEEMYLGSATIAGKRTKLVGQAEAVKTTQELNAIVWE
jgi:hypothetical protein